MTAAQLTSIILAALGLLTSLAAHWRISKGSSKTGS